VVGHVLGRDGEHQRIGERVAGDELVCLRFGFVLARV
jgi:hypothetical protein